jgi:hypothetical protein
MADPAKLAHNEVVLLHAVMGRCEACHGEECEFCEGDGEVSCNCSKCDDDHAAECAECRGTGYRKKPEQYDIYNRCPKCLEAKQRIIALRHYYPGCDPHQGQPWMRF